MTVSIKTFLSLKLNLISLYKLKGSSAVEASTGKNSRKPSMVKKMVICKFPRGITINEKAGHLPLMFLLIIYINVRGTNH